MERKEINRIKEKIRLTRRLGISETMLATSVVGVATMLGLVENETVTYGDHKPSSADNTLWIYGTTDFANPVEAIMVAAAKDGHKGQGIYITDPDAHTVSSYLERILIPSLGSLFHLPEDEVERLNQKAKKLPALHDIELDILQKHFGIQSLNDYLEELRKKAGPVLTFSQLYKELNRKLCQNLGIEHFEACNFFAQKAPLRVGDIIKEAIKIAATVTNNNTRIDAQLDLTIETGLHDLGLNKHNAVPIVTELKNEFFEHVLGGRNWGLKARKFFRRNTGLEESVDCDDLDHSDKLCGLGYRGIVLGGNAWVLAMQLVEKVSSGVDLVVITHKNTRSGANYTLPLLAAERTRAYVSPIVRVVPNGQEALKGDGLDIGAYILNPSLVEKVRSAFFVTEPEVVGGKRKIVIETSGLPPTMVAYTEPSDSSNKNARRSINL